MWPGRRYERTKEEVSKWQTLVKAHREAPTLSFLAGRGDAGRPATTAALVDRQVRFPRLGRVSRAQTGL